MEAFSIKNLTFYYPECDTPALDDISLTVNKGEFFVLCGYSGSGKSTLLRHLKPALSPVGKKTGEVFFCGNGINSLSKREKAAKIGFVLQSPEEQTVTDKVWHELAFGLESLGLDTDTIRRRTAETAAYFGIEDWYYKNVSELSGGQKQLLALASVTVMQPEVLILDEPTSQLDPIAAGEFLSTLYKINRELGITIILSEHRLEDALCFADKAAVMEKGKITVCGTVKEIGKALKKNKSGMFHAMPAAMRIWGGLKTDEDCLVTVNEGRAFFERYTENKIPRAFLWEKPTGNGKTSVELNELWFRYEKDEPDIIKGLKLSARFGEHLCILGGNGAGKTTALKIISGIKKAYRGDISINGKTALLPQNPQTVFTEKTVYEDLMTVLKARKIPTEKADGEIEKVASICKITPLLYRHPYDLSGGEQERAALAKILLTVPDILLLDEPTKGLDAPFKKEFAKILARLKAGGVSIITVSHDVEFCAKYADSCALFFDGKIAAEGTPNEFFAGNGFYTTAANRIARDFSPLSVTAEQVIYSAGGEIRKVAENSEKPPEFIKPAEKAKETKKLPLWRKICGGVSAVSAVITALYCAKYEDFSEFIGKSGSTTAGIKQFLYYGAVILFLVLSAVFFSKKQPQKPIKQTKKENRHLNKRTVFSCVSILILVPVTLFIGVFYLKKSQYYLTAVLVALECMLPFFVTFEGRKPKAREITVIAVMCAMGIASRAAFFMLPQFKPVMAIAIISGVALGGESGFLVGAVSMLVSNMFFGQGPWTPFQMFAMGIVGFLAGVLYKKGVLVRSKISLSVFGSLCAVIIYGGILNPVSALIWAGESLNTKIIIAYYISGFPLDLVHAAATALFLWFAADPILEKLDRIKTKYGLLE